MQTKVEEWDSPKKTGKEKADSDMSPEEKGEIKTKKSDDHSEKNYTLHLASDP